MKDLKIFYCTECGYYGYYCLQERAVCPRCGIHLTQMNMGFQVFMGLNSEQRDMLIATAIAGKAIPDESMISRLHALPYVNNMRELVGDLQHDNGRRQRVIEDLTDKVDQLWKDNEALRRKNRELEETVSWMHDMIWDLLRRLNS